MSTTEIDISDKLVIKSLLIGKDHSQMQGVEGVLPSEACVELPSFFSMPAEPGSSNISSLPHCEMARKYNSKL